MPFRPFKTALVLGGGGARGLAHLGVLKALGEAGFAPDILVGTSFGSIVGASYALEPDPRILRGRFLEVLRDENLARIEKEFGEPDPEKEEGGWLSRLGELLGAARRVLLWNRTILRTSLLDGAVVAELIEQLVGRSKFADLALPFHAVAYDLLSDRDVIVGHGSLATALRASSAIPGVFEPVSAGPWLLVDGAVFQELPVRAARQLGADLVVAVDVSSENDRRPPGSAAEVWRRVMEIRGRHFLEESRALADVVVRPAVSEIHWSEFSRFEECYEAGVEAARRGAPAVLSAARRARYRSVFRRLFLAPPPVEIARVEEEAEEEG